MSPSYFKVALLGRPNVGKSTLFNRLIRSNRAITHDRPGITRDRMEGIVRCYGYDPFIIIDTGGVTLDNHAHVEEGPKEIRGFENAILAQANDAIRESSLLCLVVDAREGLTPFDHHLADFLRKSGKPLIIIANKIDGPEKADLLMAEFHILGLEVFPCSAAHGFNVRELEDEIRTLLGSCFQETSQQAPPAADGPSSLHDTQGGIDADTEPAEDDDIDIANIQLDEYIKTEGDAEDGTEDTVDTDADATGDEEASIPPVPEEEEAPQPAETIMADPHSGPLRLALLGRPNAGKSSLVNAMTGTARMIVSDVAGTTRDSVDVAVEIDGEPCVFVDTAGVRRRARISDTVERYSVNSSIKSTTKAHVTLLMLDACEGITLQDKRLIDLLNERKTPFMVLVNKWDLIEPRERNAQEKEFKEILNFCQHVPLLFISVVKKRDLMKIVPLARSIRNECRVRISTGKLNRAMDAVLGQHQPPIVKGGRAKFFYLTQAESAPPTFVFFVNNADRVLASYARYLERSLRRLFQITHAPMRVHFRSSHKKRTK